MCSVARNPHINPAKNDRAITVSIIPTTPDQQGLLVQRDDPALVHP